jgi:hypothetical protein
MGDICDMNDIKRFIRSIEGRVHLGKIAAGLKGKKIVDVKFSNEVHAVAIRLHLNDGKTLVVFQPSLKVEVLREGFGEVLQREYLADYPERATEGR